MFEITDDDDGFWEKLPLDEVGFKSETEPPNSLCVKKGIDFPSVSSSLKPGFSNSKVSPCYSPLVLSHQARNDSNDKTQENRPQLVQIHNVLASDRTLDRTCLASTSALMGHNDYHTKRIQVPDPLQPNCSSADQLPSRPSHISSYKPGSKRKFPGPAGILPSSFPSDSTKLQQDDSSVVKDPTCNEVFPSSQPSTSCDPFSSVPWQSLVSDIGPDAKSILSKFAIRSMLSKASKRVLPKGKIPLVLAFIDSVDFHGCDGTAVLKDPSGKVHGALHNDLVKDPSTALKAGWVIVLRQTSVISPTPRIHYLNITPANIVVIYSQTKDSPNVRKLPWSPTVSPNSSTTSTFPSLPQIIQESDNELMSALNYPPTPQQHPGTRCHTPGSRNLPQMPLFGGVSSNSPSVQSLGHFPVTTPNGRVNSGFKSPVTSHPATPSSFQKNITNHSNNPYQPRTLNTHNHHLSSRFGGINNSSRPLTSNGPTLSFTPHDSNCLPFPSNVLPNLPSTSTMHPHISNKTSVQTKSMLQDDFLDDDSDLLSLCDDSEMMTSINNKTDLNNRQNNEFDSRDRQSSTSAWNTTQSTLGKPFSVNDRNFRSVQLGKTGRNLKDTVKYLEQFQEADNCLKGGADVGVTACGSNGTRDARVQLGVSKPHQQHTTAELALGIWDDDLDDELLSQL